MLVSKPDFLYLEYSLSLFCIAEIIYESNQDLELAFTLAILIRVTQAIALMNLFTKCEYAAFTQVFFKQSGKWIF